MVIVWVKGTFWDNLGWMNLVTTYLPVSTFSFPRSYWMTPISTMNHKVQFHKSCSAIVLTKWVRGSDKLLNPIHVMYWWYLAKTVGFFTSFIWAFAWVGVKNCENLSTSHMDRNIKMEPNVFTKTTFIISVLSVV